MQEIAASGKKSKLLLQSCCGPCSSHVLDLLSPFFEITVFYFDPNIFPEEEYLLRLDTQKQLIAAMGSEKIALVEGEYDHESFLNAVKGLENEPEGGARCAKCFEQRLEATAKKAKEAGYDYFCTTLTVSPHKNADVINKIGFELQDKYGVKFLPSDFKKKDGYKRSIELSAKFGLYRQNYCGCEFSKK